MLPRQREDQRRKYLPGVVILNLCLKLSWIVKERNFVRKIKERNICVSLRRFQSKKRRKESTKMSQTCYFYAGIRRRYKLLVSLLSLACSELRLEQQKAGRGVSADFRINRPTDVLRRQTVRICAPLRFAMIYPAHMRQVYYDYKPVRIQGCLLCCLKDNKMSTFQSNLLLNTSKS